jgi:hypothetical protein
MSCVSTFSKVFAPLTPTFFFFSRFESAKILETASMFDRHTFCSRHQKAVDVFRPMEREGERDGEGGG